jgi:hypothetical protein
LRKMTPGGNRVADVLDGGLFRAGEPCEIHVLVGSNDQMKMLRCLSDKTPAVGDFRGKNAIELLSKHLYFIMAFEATRR